MKAGKRLKSREAKRNQVLALGELILALIKENSESYNGSQIWLQLITKKKVKCKSQESYFLLPFFLLNTRIIL